jgi:hypothetical protein
VTAIREKFPELEDGRSRDLAAKQVGTLDGMHAA